MGLEVNPRELTYSGTCHQWFCFGARARRVFPTICIHMCSVSWVSRHSASVRLGHIAGGSPGRSLLGATIAASIGTNRERITNPSIPCRVGLPALDRPQPAKLFDPF